MQYATTMGEASTRQGRSEGSATDNIALWLSYNVFKEALNQIAAPITREQAIGLQALMKVFAGFTGQDMRKVSIVDYPGNGEVAVRATCGVHKAQKEVLSTGGTQPAPNPRQTGYTHTVHHTQSNSCEMPRLQPAFSNPTASTANQGGGQIDLKTLHAFWKDPEKKNSIDDTLLHVTRQQVEEDGEANLQQKYKYQMTKKRKMLQRTDEEPAVKHPNMQAALAATEPPCQCLRIIEHICIFGAPCIYFVRAAMPLATFLTRTEPWLPVDVNQLLRCHLHKILLFFHTGSFQPCSNSFKVSIDERPVELSLSLSVKSWTQRILQGPNDLANLFKAESLVQRLHRLIGNSKLLQAIFCLLKVLDSSLPPFHIERCSQSVHGKAWKLFSSLTQLLKQVCIHMQGPSKGVVLFAELASVYFDSVPYDEAQRQLMTRLFTTEQLTPIFYIIDKQA